MSTHSPTAAALIRLKETPGVEVQEIVLAEVMGLVLPEDRSRLRSLISNRISAGERSSDWARVRRTGPGVWVFDETYDRHVAEDEHRQSEHRRLSVIAEARRQGRWTEVGPTSGGFVLTGPGDRLYLAIPLAGFVPPGTLP